MFKLQTKRGVLQQNLEPNHLTVDFWIDTLEVACRWRYPYSDLEKGDDILVVGYMGKDEYNDPIFYGRMYFNLSKNVQSVHKPLPLLLFGAAVLPAICWSMLKKEYLIGGLLLLLAGAVFYEITLGWWAFYVLKKAMKHLQ
jgi:hypothetical protein